MAKRSRKRTPRPEKDPTGCMWGLINMFDFRQGNSATKLLSDTKCGSSRRSGTKYSKNKLKSLTDFEDTQEVDDVYESRGQSVDLAMTCVKTLMEEDMSRVHSSKKIRSEEIEQIRPKIGLEVHLEKKYKQPTQNFKVISDFVNDLRDHTCLESEKANCMDPTERSSLNLDLFAFMINFYGDNHQCQEKNVGYNSKTDPCTVSETVDNRKHKHLEEPDLKLAEKQVMLHKSLVDVADVFLSQKSIDTKHFSGEVQSQEFMDKLEILNTNKELLSSLLHDPNSLLLKLVQDHQNAQVGKLSQLESGKYLEASELVEEIGSSGQCEEPITQKLLSKQSGYKLFRKKDKSERTKLSGNDDSFHASNKIVVLKPIPSIVQNSSITISPSSLQSYHSLISLKEIKRKLRKIIGSSRKERHVISMEGILHRIPYRSKDSDGPGKKTARDSVEHDLTSKTYYDTEYASHSSAAARKGDEKDKQKGHHQNMKNENNFLLSGNERRLNITATAHPLNRESFNEEAKKHLAEILDTGDNNDILQVRERSKPLGSLLLLPEYSISPRFSPRRDKGADLSLTEGSKQDDATNYLSPLIQDLEKTSRGDDNPDDDKAKVEGTGIVEDLKQKGSIELVAKTDIISKEECNGLDANSESNSNDPGGTSEKCIEEGSPIPSENGSPQERSPATPRLSNSCSSLLKQIIKDPESILDKPEQPSPVSVLEPLFSEDVNSSGSELDESPLCPQNNNLEESDSPDVALKPSDSEANPSICVNDDAAGRFEFVRVVLEVSGLSCNEISNRWLSSSQLLDPSLFSEVGISYSQLSDDPELLFDCISQVLEEIQERLFSCTPWISFIKHNVRPVPFGGNLIEEVCKVIERHLEWQYPRTLDQIVKKDMDGGNWMEHRSDTQSIVIEMGDAILRDLMEEMALEMWV